MPGLSPKGVKNYTVEDIQKAMDLVRHDGLSIAAAAKSYGIPKSTLQDKISGKYKIESKIGRPSVFTPEEENTIVKWTVDVAKAGFPVTKDQLIWTVHKLIKETNRKNPFPNGIPGDKWYNLFLRRHPTITERTSQVLTSARGNVTEERLRQWFLEVRTYIEEKGITDVFKSPKSVFNADETAFFLCPKGKRVLAKKGEKQVHSLSGNDDKECITVLVNANANGDIAPPMIVYDYLRIPEAVIRNMPDGWGVGKTESGWMTCETFFEYVTNVFYPWLMDNNIPFPVLLFIDGHTSHMSLPLSEFCSSKNIEVVALLPNATHILQPMDVAVFRPLKSAWKKHVQQWKFNNSGRKMRKDEFAPLLSQVFEESLKRETLKNGFKTTGLLDLNPNSVNYSKLLMKSPDETSSLNKLHSKLKDEQAFMNKLEIKIGLGTVRRFSMAAVETTEEALYTVWKKTKEDIVQLNSEIQENERKDREQKETARKDERVPEEREIAIEDDVDADLEDLGQENMAIEEQIEKEETERKDGNAIEESDISMGENIHEDLQESDLLDNGDNVICEIKKLLDGTTDIEHESVSNILEPANNDTIDLANISTSDIIFCDQGIEFEVEMHTENPLENGSNSILILPSTSTFQKTPEKENNSLSLAIEETGPNPKTSYQSALPSPFKRSLFWPDNNLTSIKKRKPKEKIPAVVTSEQYKAYFKKKDEEKKKKETEKEIKRLQREAKKTIKQEETNKKVTKRKKKLDSVA